MTSEEQNYMDKDSIKLSNELTEQILAEIKEKSGVVDPQGFLQVVFIRQNGPTVLAIDGRALCNHQVQPAGKIVRVEQHDTIVSVGSCTITSVVNGNIKSWEFSNDFCPPHSH